jgi:hypothetical protein
VKRTIVLARLVDDVEVVRQRRTDLGERPVTRAVKRAEALVWLLRGNPDDAEKARAFADREGWRVILYPTSEHDPLARAKAELQHNEQEA